MSEREALDADEERALRVIETAFEAWYENRHYADTRYGRYLVDALRRAPWFAAGRPAKNDATLVLGETPLGDTAVFLRIPNQPDILLREKCETDDEQWALIERNARAATCPTSCVETNHPGREHEVWRLGVPHVDR